MALLTHRLPCGYALVYRDVSDPYIIAESGKRLPPYFRHGDILPTDIIMDIGAQIGITALWAASLGRRVYAYEAEPANYALLEQNTRAVTPITIARGFVCGNTRSPGEDVPFYVARRNLSAHSAFIKRGRGRILVPAIPIGPLLNAQRPDVVKMDCEGAEYEILLDGLLDAAARISVITFEAHFGRPEWHEQYQRVRHALTAQGFTVQGKERSSGWPVFCHASRREGHDAST